MDFVDLFARPSLAGSPVSLILRPGDAPLEEQARQAATLLRATQSTGEILLPAPSIPTTFPPAKIQGLRVRVIAPIAAERWMELLKHARHSKILVLSPASLPSVKELTEFIEQLEHADVVVGKRAAPGLVPWLRWPIDRLLRSLWGLPFTDPYCPTRGFRRAAIEGIALESSSSLADLEILAKTTYLVRLVDEVPLIGPSPRASVASTLFSSGFAALRLFFSPTFGQAKTYLELTQPELTTNAASHAKVIIPKRLQDRSQRKDPSLLILRPSKPWP